MKRDWEEKMVAARRAGVLAVVIVSCLLWPTVRAADTLEVRHGLGVTVVPKNPKRVVTFDLSILDSIDALDIEGLHIAVPKQGMPPYLAKYMAEEFVDAGGMKDPNLERIFEFRPDIVFLSGRQTDYYDKLSLIAPTVCPLVDFSDFMASFKRNMLMLGDVFDVREKAEAMSDLIADKAAAVAAKAEKTGKTGLIVMVNDGNISTYGPGSRFGVIHDVFHVAPADAGINASIHGQSVDFEYIAKIDPDILFVISRNAAIGSRRRSMNLENELVLNTKAGKSGKIVYLDSAVWYPSGAGLESLDLMIDEVSKALD